MKNKNAVKKKILIILAVIIFLVFLYSLMFVIRSGKQDITVSTTTNFYSGSNLEALVDVTKKKTSEHIKSDIIVELLNNDDKKVKGVKNKYKLEEDKQAEISLKLPEELESGKYILKVTSKSGILKDVCKVPINVTKGKDSETVISLDKGIYKPGDEIAYRALILSKKDNTPVLTEATINIFDGNNNKVYSENVTTSEFGIVSGKFKLSDTVNSGTYKLTVSTPSAEVTKEFKVNPYVTPKFEIDIATDKEIYTIGEKANITVNAKYFFGEPVTNATVSGILDGEEFAGLTNESGTFTKEVEVKEAGTHVVKLSVVDSSNYFIETSKSYVGATDIFEIEILPEYGNIVQGIDNDIYLITKSADSKPVKTYMEVKLGNITREVVTDEKGVGKVTLTSSDIQNIRKAEKIEVTAEDMSGQKVNKSENIDIEVSTGTIVKTDKIKYNENENINVSLAAMTDYEQIHNLYIFKNKELIKTISFEGDKIDFNLDGISGLIDICTDANYYRHRYYKNNKFNEKTIFIKPSKNLKINIETEKDTYQPKENLNIKFDVSDEKNEKTDAALLVSILDEAVLSLAENDLSIDNLKIALGDIKLSDGITAADLYTMILDDSNETALNSILLKQNNKCIENITTNTSYNDKEDYYVIAMIISAALLIGIVFKYFCDKYEKFKKITASLGIATIDICAIFLIVAVYFGESIVNIFYELDIESIFHRVYISYWLTIAVCAVSSIVLYTLILYKQKNYMFTLIFELTICPAIIAIVIGILTEITGLTALPIIITLILLLLLCMLSVISRTRELNKFWNFIKENILIFAKAIFFWGATFIVSAACDSIVGFLIVLLVYVLYEKFVLKKTDTKMREGKIILNITGNELIGVFCGIIFILMIITFLDSISRFSSKVTITDSISHIDEEYPLNFSNTESDMLAIDTAKGNANTGSTLSESIIPSNIFGSDVKEEIQKQDISSEEKEIKVEENVRNVFLESLAFVPEIVTKDGKASYDTKISDNITTWSIQTVGNSKDGKLGFSSKNFKVFKEFFVDFSLPTNTVVTDNISIPVTVYNYTEKPLDVELNVVSNEWSKIGEYQKLVNVPANSTQMVYVPLEIIKSGYNSLRIESKSGNISDIVEKKLNVSINGLQKEEVISSGSTEKKIDQDILFREKAIEKTQKIKVKLYPSTISQIIENMDEILQMPTGCFEQVSSSLYPDLLALKYLKDNNLNSPKIEEKALEYINAGYQKLLTYEVKGQKGGYSLYGRSPAEPVITAFGLMEMNDLSEVYSVDENIILNMKEYLFSEQKGDGSFDYVSTYIGGTSSDSDLAMNAYIIWALSEVCPEDKRLEKSIKYLEKKLDSVEDNYSLALIANVFSNTKNDKTNDVIKRLMKEVKTIDNDSAYISSSVKGYLGCYGRLQDIQATALTSIVLTKEKSNDKTNKALINYIIECKDENGTWHNTQSTVLGLKALNDFNTGNDIKNQTITVTLNGNSKEIKVEENTLDLYEIEFEDVEVENKISISLEKGKVCYEIIKEYYETYEQAEAEQMLKSSGKIVVNQTINQEVNVNDIISQKFELTNLSENDISNAIIRLNIPQGCAVLEDSLLQLEYENKIEKYEYNYNTIDLYLRNFEANEKLDFKVNYRTGYPEKITGAAINVYDYYNPEMKGFGKPVEITVK